VMHRPVQLQDWIILSMDNNKVEYWRLWREIWLFTDKNTNLSVHISFTNVHFCFKY